MRKRTRFNVIIPPWRQNRRGHPITLEFVLTGKIPSKKNRQRASFNYSWAIGQVRSFFKKQTPGTLTLPATLKFVVSLIRSIKPFIYKPIEIVEWEKQAIELLIQQVHYWRKVYAAQGLAFPITLCSISIKHYWADEYQRDNSNREQTIHDILITAGIISDDNYKCLYKIESEADCFKDEILDHITTINLTAYRW